MDPCLNEPGMTGSDFLVLPVRGMGADASDISNCSSLALGLCYNVDPCLNEQGMAGSVPLGSSCNVTSAKSRLGSMS